MNTSPAQPSPAVAARWRVVAASVTGRRHLAQQQPCQDAVRFEVGPRPWLLAVVADGAGSAKHGEIGATTATTAALAELRRGLDGLASNRDTPALRAIIEAALEAARRAISAEAAARQAAVGDLATTLAVCAAGPELVAVAQVGDGAVVVREASGELRSLTKPAVGEYLNETVFLTSENALASAQYAIRPGPVSHVAMFSDGLQMLALRMPGAVPHAPFFSPLFAWLRQVGEPGPAGQELAAWLGSSRVGARTDDDVTLLLADRGT